MEREVRLHYFRFGLAVVVGLIWMLVPDSLIMVVLNALLIAAIGITGHIAFAQDWPGFTAMFQTSVERDVPVHSPPNEEVTDDVESPDGEQGEQRESA